MHFTPVCINENRKEYSTEGLQKFEPTASCNVFELILCNFHRKSSTPSFPMSVREFFY